MDSQNLVSGDDGGRIQFSPKGNVLGKYLNKKLTWMGTILGFPPAVILCTIQILLMVTFIPMDYYYYQLQFEYSGFGIISAVTYLVASTITIKNILRPTYAKVWLTLFSQLISFGVGVGLIVFALSSILGQYGPGSSRQLLECNCLDAAGNIERNGTYPDSWDCRNTKPLTCVDVDQKINNWTWRNSLLWIIIGSASFQCICSVIHLLLSARALFWVGEAFDKVAIVTNEIENEFVVKNAYNDGFPTKVLYIVGWVQVGLAMLSMLLSATSGDGPSWGGRGGSDLFQFCAVGSFVLLNLMSTMKPDLTYARLSGLGILHLLSIGTMIGTVAAMGGPVVFPFAGIEILLSGFILLASFRPILKVDRLMNQQE